MSAMQQLFTSGQQIQQGRYVVKRPLSKGGMGAIYLATQRIAAIDRDVVLKVMLDDFDPNDQAAVKEAHNLFHMEAQTLAKLNHDHIAQILDFFIENGTPVIVMEYIPGKSLEEHLTHEDAHGNVVPGKPFPQHQVLRWGIVLCEILEYLSEQQPDPVVHHDIKPANIILDKEKLRLVDFGAAKIRHGVGNGSYAKTTLFGTRGYAPPEQIRGESEPRSDVYALAVTLYHLVTDQPPLPTGITKAKLQPLGRFGLVLAGALAPIARDRPRATELKEQLKRLIPAPSVSPASHILIAPDGTQFQDVTQLVKWCVEHWQHAANWLYGTMPQQIQIHWQNQAIGAQLQHITASEKNRNRALDVSLSKLDPQGYGMTKPRVHAPGRLDFKGIAVDGKATLQINVQNPGPRYVETTLYHPKWIIAEPAYVQILPLQSVVIALTADMARVAVGGAISGKLRLFDHEVILEAHVSTWQTGVRQVSRGTTTILNTGGRVSATVGKSVVTGIVWLLAGGAAIVSHEAVLAIIGVSLLGGLAGGFAGFICWFLLGFLSAWFPNMLSGGVGTWAAEIGRAVLTRLGGNLEATAPIRFSALGLGIGMALIYAAAGAVYGLLLTLLSRSPFKGMLFGIVPGAGCGCLLGIPVVIVLWLVTAVMALFGGAFMSGSTGMHIILILSLIGVIVGGGLAASQ